MTRQEAIDRWRLIARTVFSAEDAILPQWRERLIGASELSNEERTLLADEYCRAIATEIVSKASDEQLEAIGRRD